jgi:hypothetical protein
MTTPRASDPRIAPVRELGQPACASVAGAR